MIKFDKPKNLNGAELLAELAVGGVVANHKTSPFIDGNGNFWLDIDEADKAKAITIVAAHNGAMVAPDTAAARQAILKRLGITEEEARLLLGGN
jgi:hypothetical protein